VKVTVLGPPGTAPIVLDATTVFVTKDDGTPFVAAGLLGSDNGRALVAYSLAGQPDFNHVLRQLGYTRTVVVDKLKV
jgi:hypothetical protein